jgi:hypothetical protein
MTGAFLAPICAAAAVADRRYSTIFNDFQTEVEPWAQMP